MIAELPFPHRTWGKAGWGTYLQAAHAKHSPGFAQLVCLLGGGGGGGLEELHRWWGQCHLLVHHNVQYISTPLWSP